MRKKSYRSYLIFGALLLTLFYLPSGFVEGIRGLAIGMVGKTAGGERERREDLTTQNLLLKKQNDFLRRRLLSEERNERYLERVKALSALDSEKFSSFFQRRKEAAERLLELGLLSQPAEVIYRDPSQWNSILWIDLGEGEVEVNSPVLTGEYLIGLVEYVGKRKSRVRLLTDSSLVPSVRVARGGENLRELARQVDGLTQSLLWMDEPQETFLALNRLKERLMGEKEEQYLAKGELYGSRAPLWRGRSEFLSGVGFNYDFEDEEGEARELRSGAPINKLGQETAIALIDVGDLLVTTGMDGVFPKDIPVARVTRVETLKEGSPAIEIEARLCAGNLNDLLDVTVLPPLGHVVK